MRISDWSSDVCSSDLLRALSRKAFYDPPSEAHRNTADILDGARGIAGRAYGIVDVALIPSSTRNAEEPRVHIAASTQRPAFRLRLQRTAGASRVARSSTQLLNLNHILTIRVVITLTPFSTTEPD